MNNNTFSSGHDTSTYGRQAFNGLMAIVQKKSRTGLTAFLFLLYIMMGFPSMARAGESSKQVFNAVEKNERKVVTPGKQKLRCLKWRPPLLTEEHEQRRSPLPINTQLSTCLKKRPLGFSQAAILSCPDSPAQCQLNVMCPIIQQQ